MKLNQPIVLAVAMAASLATSALSAQEARSLEQAEADKLMALPELSEPAVTTSSTSIMRCFVDTPALDPWTSPLCFSSGTAFTTSAVFQITNPPSNFTVFWSDSRCNSSFSGCTLPIHQFQQITLDATVLDHDTSTFFQVSATARYEGFQ